MAQTLLSSPAKPRRLAGLRQSVARVTYLPARDSGWDALLQMVITGGVVALFIAWVAAPALERYMQAARMTFLPFTGLWRPSVESFTALSLIILVAVILARFPWFLYTSFQTTKKARLGGEIWVDLEQLSYSERLCASGEAEQLLSAYSGARTSDSGDAVPGAAQPGPNANGAVIAFTKRFEDSYGYRPFRGPLISVTVFYLIGWLMVLLPTGLSALPGTSSGAGSATVGMAGLGMLISNGMKGYITEVAANLSVVSAAFLGAYSFSVTSLFRRYVRSDFKPTAITQSSLRFVTAVITGFILSLLPSDVLRLPRVSSSTNQDLLLVLAFFMGIFALNGVNILWELTSKTIPELTKFGRGLKPSELTELDGLDAWHEDRLNEAGIDSVRGLANVDFLDLLIGVRMPTQTLVDWVDQALLRIHCTSDAWAFLLKHTSIRSASDMITFLDDPKGKQYLQQVVASVTDPKERPVHLGEADIEMLNNILRQEPNVMRVRRFWRRQLPANEESVEQPAAQAAQPAAAAAVAG